MGQYFKPVLLVTDSQDHRDVEVYHSWDIHHGAKLMEHSWIGNDFVNAVVGRIQELVKEDATVRLAWVGDYSDDPGCMAGHPDHGAGYEAAHGAWLDVHSPLRMTFKRLNTPVYICNTERREAVRMEWESEGWRVHPLPLLTAVGNGLGGGDYHGPGQDLVGSWAYCPLTVMAEPPRDFTLIPEDIFRD